MNAWLGLVTLTCVLLAAGAVSAGEEAKVSCVKTPPLDKANAFYPCLLYTSDAADE